MDKQLDQDEAQANLDNEMVIEQEHPVRTYPRAYFRKDDPVGVVIANAVHHAEYPEYTYLNPLDFGMETAPAAKKVEAI